MDRVDKERWIRRVARLSCDGLDCILWSRHAIARAVTAGLDRSAVQAALVDGEVIEDYQDLNRPLPDCLVLAKLPIAEPIHAVVAIDEPNERMFLVTVYRPDPARWLDERTRKHR